MSVPSEREDNNDGGEQYHCRVRKKHPPLFMVEKGNCGVSKDERNYQLIEKWGNKDKCPEYLIPAGVIVAAHCQVEHKPNKEIQRRICEEKRNRVLSYRREENEGENEIKRRNLVFSRKRRDKDKRAEDKERDGD